MEAAKSKLEDCLSVVKCIKRDDSNNSGIISLDTFRHLLFSAVGKEESGSMSGIEGSDGGLQ